MYADPPALTHDQHAVTARAACQRIGLADCIHYAPRWRERADALYAYANSTGLPWWRGDGGIGLLPDGRMAIVGDVVCIVEA